MCDPKSRPHSHVTPKKAKFQSGLKRELISEKSLCESAALDSGEIIEPESRIEIVKINTSISYKESACILQSEI
jgi:hypothetical protein